MWQETVDKPTVKSTKQDQDGFRSAPQVRSVEDVIQQKHSDKSLEALCRFPSFSNLRLSKFDYRTKPFAPDYGDDLSAPQVKSGEDVISMDKIGVKAPLGQEDASEKPTSEKIEEDSVVELVKENQERKVDTDQAGQDDNESDHSTLVENENFEQSS